MSKIERQAASDAALASVNLEGFVVPKDVLTEAEKYIEGEISPQELIDHLYQKIKSSRAGNN